MTVPQFPKVQGFHASWANFKIRIRLSDSEFSTPDIASVKWEDEMAIGKVRGQGTAKRGTTEGEYDANAELALYRAAAKGFQKALAAVNKKITLVHFDLFGHYEPYDTEEISEVRLVGCRVLKRTSDMKPGTDAAMITFPLDVMKIYEDGICLNGDD